MPTSDRCFPAAADQFLAGYAAGEPSVIRRRYSALPPAIAPPSLIAAIRLQGR